MVLYLRQYGRKYHCLLRIAMLWTIAYLIFFLTCYCNNCRYLLCSNKHITYTRLTNVGAILQRISMRTCLLSTTPVYGVWWDTLFGMRPFTALHQGFTQLSTNSKIVCLFLAINCRNCMCQARHVGSLSDCWCLMILCAEGAVSKLTTVVGESLCHCALVGCPATAHNKLLCFMYHSVHNLMEHCYNRWTNPNCQYKWTHTQNSMVMTSPTTLSTRITRFNFLSSRNSRRDLTKRPCAGVQLERATLTVLFRCKVILRWRSRTSTGHEISIICIIFQIRYARR